MTNDQSTMIEDCMNRSERLTEWESNFIESISTREMLTDKQDEKLNTIWDRVTEEG